MTSVTTVDKLANAMAEAILSGEFAPGYRLDEQLLAQRDEVSRTPVREALRQLATTGLIEIRPRRGAIVTRVTPEQLEELFVAMGELEATCARRPSGDGCKPFMTAWARSSGNRMPKPSLTTIIFCTR